MQRLSQPIRTLISPRSLWYLCTSLTAVFMVFWVSHSLADACNPAQLARRMSLGAGMPVSIATTQFALWPAPHLEARQLTIDHDITIDRASINLSPRLLLSSILDNHGRYWAEAELSPLTINISQAERLYAFANHLALALPSSIGRIHIGQVRFSDLPWLEANWDASIDNESGLFQSALLQASNPHGAWIQTRVSLGDSAQANFEAQGAHWPVALLPQADHAFENARGYLSQGNLTIDRYSLASALGEIHGAATATRSAQGAWTIRGSMKSDSLDLAELSRYRPNPEQAERNDAEHPPHKPLLAGTASYDGTLDGEGKSALDAYQSTRLHGHLLAREAVIQGANLGYLAMHPGAQPFARQASTQLPSLSADVFQQGDQTTLSHILGTAGALTMSGSAHLTRQSQQLQGSLNVSFSTMHTLRPFQVHLSGTLETPEFSR